MSKLQVVAAALDFRTPPYVPWSFGFTQEAAAKLEKHFGTNDLEPILGNHLQWLGDPCGCFVDLPGNRVRDYFGVVWNRMVDKDIGVVESYLLPEPTLAGYRLPDPTSSQLFAAVPQQIERSAECFRVYPIGFSLYERAWTLRGMENLLADFIEHPQFVHELLGSIADYNIAQARKALTYDIDGLYFGDDWGQQHGLQMGYARWKEFLYPQLKRQYAVVRDAGKKVFIHSCGDVDELFDDLVEIGVNCFNPFQPEVMDVHALHARYHGRLAFHGGLSTQRTLPYGTAEDVVKETGRLIAMGKRGGYILAPAHAVEGDVPLENMLAFIETAQKQAR